MKTIREIQAELLLKGYDPKVAYSKTTKTLIEFFTVPVWGSVENGIASHFIKRFGPCIKKCDKYYTTKQVLMGFFGLSYFSSAGITRLFSSKARRICIAKCKIDMYRAVGDREKELFWRYKLQKLNKNMKDAAEAYRRK